MNWVPIAFVGALSLLLVVFGVLAARQILTRSSPLAATANLSAPDVASDGKVEVRIWIPSDAQAQVGGEFVPQASKARIFPGPTIMELYFDSGAQLSCEFVAEEGAAVRYVGEGAISVDDGAAMPCTQTRPATDAG